MSGLGPNDNPTGRALNQLCEEFLGKVIEHADSVQVLVTYRPEGGECTKFLNRGRGNVFARIAQAQLYLDFEREYHAEEARIEARKDAGL